MSKKKSSSSSEDEKDSFDEDFLNVKVEDIPIQVKGTEEVESEIAEIMKSGCNRQIAEYVMILYYEIEKDKEINLIKLRKAYEKVLKEQNNIMSNTISSLKDYLNKIKDDNEIKIKEKDLEEISEKIPEYELEVEEILENEDIEKCFEQAKIKGEEEKYKLIKYFLNENISKLDSKIRDELNEKSKKYKEKRDAVIEFGLRNVKKIINNQNEYDKFVKEYKKYQDGVKKIDWQTK